MRMPIEAYVRVCVCVVCVCVCVRLHTRLIQRVCLCVYLLSIMSQRCIDKRVVRPNRLKVRFRKGEELHVNDV